jgi:hypothetical protein
MIHVQAGGKVRDVVVFIVGGATYEESACVHQLNTTYASQGEYKLCVCAE